jgi:hypothetical protein
MKLFILKTHCYYDGTYEQVIIRAESEEQARNIAYETTKWCQGDDFLKPDKSNCLEVTVEGNADFITGYYNS